MTSRTQTKTPPKSILILGSGVFGLSTAYTLTQRPLYKNTIITLIDRSPFPPSDSSSIDSSRIIRADYHDPAYASLASLAQESWRAGFGGTGVYSESGLVLVCDKGKEEYVRASFENVTALSKQSGDSNAIKLLKSRKDIDAAIGTGGGSGDWGYWNERSGWVNAEVAMVWLRRKVEATGRVNFLTAEVIELVKTGVKITGTKLKSGEIQEADLTILATGAWSPKFVNLQGRAQATGQVICYLHLSPAEQEKLSKIPVVLNMSSGLFIIPPRDNMLKIARHGYGYINPLSIRDPLNTSKSITTSLPRTLQDDPKLWIPAEGEEDCRRALKEMIPSLGDRAFTKTRLCWYTDTPKGDFLIDYHPDVEGLFLATGGSGHAFKFLPIIGEKVVDCLEGQCPEEFRDKWAWPERVVDIVVTEDGSRGGKPELELDQELKRGGMSRL